MILIEAIEQLRETKRSKTFVLASKARDLPDKLEWLKQGGDITIREILEAREN